MSGGKVITYSRRGSNAYKPSEKKASLEDDEPVSSVAQSPPFSAKAEVTPLKRKSSVFDDLVSPAAKRPRLDHSDDVPDSPTANGPETPKALQRKPSLGTPTTPRQAIRAPTRIRKGPSETATPTKEATPSPSPAKSDISGDIARMPPPTLSRSSSRPMSPFQPPPTRTVASSHAMQESGECQRLLDDVNYLLDGAQPSQPATLRQQSLLSICKLCDSAESRLLLRAHGMIRNIVSALGSKFVDEAVALASITTLHILISDKLNVEYVNEASIDLLCACIARWRRPEAEDAPRHVGRCPCGCRDVMIKVRETVGELDGLGDADPASPRVFGLVLALATLKHAVQYRDDAKNMCRINGGLLLLQELAKETTATLASPKRDDETRAEASAFLTAALGVVNHLTFLNAPNRDYLVGAPAPARESVSQRSAHSQSQSDAADVSDSTMISDLLNILRTCARVDEKTSQLTGDACACLCAALTVLINLTHDSDRACTLVSASSPRDGLELIMSLLTVPAHADHHFDVVCLSLGLLINVVEHHDRNRDVLGRAAIPTIVAKVYEEGVHKDSETVILRAYAALLLGCLVRDNQRNHQAVLQELRSHGLEELVAVLESFIVLQSQAGVHTEEAHKSFTEVIAVLKYYSA